jgi:hypothetical protein
MKYIIRTISDIEKIRDQYTISLFDEVIIDKSKIKNQGVFRWALKYAFWCLKIDGTLKIVDSHYKKLSNKKRRIDFWQTKREVFKTLKSGVKSKSLENFEVLLQKVNNENYSNNGITLGVAFSGSTKEELMLFECLDSIAMSIDSSKDILTEVLVCGPSSYQSDKLLERYPFLPLKYIKYDNPIQDKRFMIGGKKNYVFSQASYNVVCILHTRICIDSSFINTIFSKKFDVLAPRVVAQSEKKYYDYISYHLLSGYNYGAAKNLILTVQHFRENYLYLLKDRYPYVDGGICIFNKASLNRLPYSENVAWDEAEDVESASRAYCDGRLIDYCSELLCTSQTVKFKVKPNIIKIIATLFFLSVANIRRWFG